MLSLVQWDPDIHKYDLPQMPVDTGVQILKQTSTEISVPTLALWNHTVSKALRAKNN